MNNKYSFNLEIGDFKELKGNAVIYWTVKNASESDSIQLLAINFVISVFPLDDNLVTATFPPIGFQDRNEFMLYVRQSRCDLIYAGEMKMKKEKDYLENLPDEEYYQLNKILNDYLDLYRDKMDNLPLNISLKEKIYLLKKMVKHYRNSLSQRNKNIHTPVNISRIRNIILSLKHSFNPFDLENFYELISQNGETVDKLLDLYSEKFIAIHYEDYETAGKLTEDIEIYSEKIKHSKKELE